MAGDRFEPPSRDVDPLAVYRSSDEPEDGIRLPAFVFDPIGVVHRRRRWMLAVAVAGLAVSLLAVLTWTPRYLAEATVLVSSQQIPEEFVRSTVTEDALSNFNALVGEALSQTRLVDLVEKYGLYPHAADGPILNRASWLRANLYVSPTIKATRGQTALVYGISFRYEDPQIAAQVANAVAALLVESGIARRNERARSATHFLQGELERDEKQFREASHAVSEFKRGNRGSLPTELDANLRRLEMLSDEQHQLVTEITEKENRIALLAGSQESMSDAQLLLTELRKQLAQESTINTDEHPNVIALRERVAAQQRIVNRERGGRPVTASGRMIVGVEREIELLRERRAEIDAQIEDLRMRVDQTPAAGEELSALEQREQILREEYLDSLRKVQEAELAESLELAQKGAQLSLLDEAQPPLRPERERWSIALLGLLVSLGGALGIAVLLELFDPVVLDGDDLERITEQPLLGTMARVP